MIPNFIKSSNKILGSSLSLPAHPSSRTLCVHYGAGGRAGAPASPAKRGERAIPFLAALFATCPPKPWRRREQKTEFGGGGKARGPAFGGINSAPSEAGNTNFSEEKLGGLGNLPHFSAEPRSGEAQNGVKNEEFSSVLREQDSNFFRCSIELAL